MNRTARCCCGDAAITVEGEPATNAICHCASCKKRSGFGWSVYVPACARSVCVRCGATLSWRSQNVAAGFTGIAGGCVVEDPIPALDFSAQDRCIRFAIPDARARAG
jgi:hypothetical protein